MARRPTILITPSLYRRGTELADPAISLAEAYPAAVLAAGGLPWVLPRCTEPAVLAEAIARSDGLLLTGGDDVAPGLYRARLTPAVAKTVVLADPQRDLQELLLIDEAFRQRKPVFGICRGQQVLNVALGGTLIADIPQQVKGALKHDCARERFQVVHTVTVAPGSLLHRLTGRPEWGVNSSHHQAVGRVAPPLRATARSADGVIEALELAPGAQDALPWLLAVQCHPERLHDREPTHLRLFQSFVLACRRTRKAP